MTPDEFRKLALDLPGAVESAHSGKPDFRVGGKIFATLGQTDDTGTLKLSPQDQETVLALAGGAAEPAAGAWGRRGWTRFRLDGIEKGPMAALMHAAWGGVAPKHRKG